MRTALIVTGRVYLWLCARAHTRNGKLTTATTFYPIGVFFSAILWNAFNLLIEAHSTIITYSLNLQKERSQTQWANDIVHRFDFDFDFGLSCGFLSVHRHTRTHTFLGVMHNICGRFMRVIHSKKFWVSLNNAINHFGFAIRHAGRLASCVHVSATSKSAYLHTCSMFIVHASSSVCLCALHKRQEYLLVTSHNVNSQHTSALYRFRVHGHCVSRSHWSIRWEYEYYIVYYSRHTGTPAHIWICK